MNVKETLIDLEQYLEDEDDKVIFKSWKDSFFENETLAEIQKIKEIKKLRDIFIQARKGAEKTILRDSMLDNNRRLYLHCYIDIVKLFEGLFTNVEVSNKIIENNLEDLKKKISK